MSLPAVFESYCAGQGTMDGKSFAKLCKDTKLLDKKFTATDVGAWRGSGEGDAGKTPGAHTPPELPDLLFAKCKTKSERRITLDQVRPLVETQFGKCAWNTQLNPPTRTSRQFRTALAEIAKKKGVDPSAVEEQVAVSGGPILTGTQADAVKWHDDKSTYTGVYAKGGPTNVDKVPRPLLPLPVRIRLACAHPPPQNLPVKTPVQDKVADLSQLANRGEADVRGRNL